MPARGLEEREFWGKGVILGLRKEHLLQCWVKRKKKNKTTVGTSLILILFLSAYLSFPHLVHLFELSGQRIR